eukprot:gene6631-13438_t
MFLVYGYGLSKVIRYRAQTYATAKVNVPADLALFLLASNPPVVTTPSRSPTIVPTRLRLNGTSRYPTRIPSRAPVRTPTAQFKIPSLAGTLERILGGPMVIPSFDQFINFVKVVSSLSRGLSDNVIVTSTALGRQYANLYRQGVLHFAPNNYAVNNLIDHLNRTTTTFHTLKTRLHDSEESAIKFILDNPSERTFALIVIESATPNNVDYTIRMNYTTLPNTNQVTNNYALGLQVIYQRYTTSGFLTLQNTIDEWAFQYTNTSSASTRSQGCNAPPVVMTPFPTGQYNLNAFYSRVGFLLGLAMTMATLYPMSRLVKSIVEEKELRLREIMKIMGLKDWVHHMAWFITSFVLFFWIALSSTYITSTKVTLSFLVAVFFNNSKIAAIVGPVVLFVSLLPRFVFIATNDFEDEAGKFAASLLSPTAFSFGADIIAQYENAGIGVQFSNLSEGTYNFGSCIQFMLLDVFLYGFLAWYLEQVLPTEYGTPRSAFFLFQKSYWCPSSGVREYRPVDDEVLANELPEMATDNAHSYANENIERLLPEQRDKVQVIIHGLQKRYDDGKLAVKRFHGIHILSKRSQDLETISLKEVHQVTNTPLCTPVDLPCKTTTIAMLTGLHQATAGDCSIWGRRLSNELPAIREMTGICPQHNVLFPCLTVSEHLRFFGCLKGLSGKELTVAVQSVVEDVGLTEKMYIASSALSGGMKRKLCLAMALIGDPKFVLLDEPTSGMDPYSRRSTWDLLQKSKTGRVVVLTTHFMDEADILGDRIAIMSEGTLRCSGSSLFLKQKFGVGYLLTFTKAAIDCFVPAVTDLVRSHVPDALLASEVAGEMVYQLPVTSVGSFGALFASLKDHSVGLGVGAYGVSITSLEQVFIRLAQEVQHLGVDEDDSNKPGYWGYVERFCGERFKEAYHWVANRIYPERQTQTQTQTQIPQYQASATQDNDNIDNAFSKTTLAITSTTTPYGNASDDNNKINGINNSNNEYQSSSQIKSMNGWMDVPLEERKDDILLPSSQQPLQAHSLPIYNKVNNNDNTPEQSNKTVPTDVEADKTNENDKDTTSASIAMKMTTTQASVFIQLQELLRKRLVITRRDIKGMFYQVFFPAIQILLVLLILTVNLSPAGRSIEMNSGLFPTSSRVVSSGNRGNLEGSDLVKTGMRLDNVRAGDSMLLSKGYLLDTYNAHGDPRLGGFFFNDQIHVNLSVNWEQTREFIITQDITFGGINPATTRINFKLLQNAYLGTLLQNIANNLNINISDSNNLNRVINQIIGTNLTVVNVNDIIKQIDRTIGRNITNDQFQNVLKRIERVVNVTVEGLIQQVEDQFNTTLNIGPLNYSATNVLDFLNLKGIKSYNIQIPNSYTVLHNSSSSHATAAYRGALIANVFSECSSVENAHYVARNHPLPLTATQAIELKILLSIFASLFILIPLCYIPASFITFIVRERVSKSKHLQIVSSVSPYLYWTATYMWDMFLYSILTVCVMCVFYIYGTAASSVFVGTSENAFAVFILIFMFGASCIPLCYIYSFFFENHSTAQISIMTINFLTGFVLVLAYFIMSNVPETQDTAKSIVHFFRLFPPYNVGEGLINVSAAYFGAFLTGKEVSYFKWEAAGRNIIFMMAEAVGFFGIVLLSESAVVRTVFYWFDSLMARSSGPPPAPKTAEDADVITEKLLLEHVNPSQYALLVRDLVKTYPPSILCGQAKHAVRGVTLGCPIGETFGLLGINGAGKTTTLSILTGDFPQTDGEAYIAGLPLSNPTTRKMVGYCPQVDPLLDLMTGYETLWFFGRIRGMESELLSRKIEELVVEVGLKKHAHRPCGTYSGGNKRKLSLAVALIGDPKVLFLDEPSTGMDPEARRHMWTVISAVAKQRSVVLTTHSMEECEALCTRVGIMVSGRMQCLGSVQHLKSRFGASYEIEVRCQHGKADQCASLCLREIPRASVEEQHGSFFRLKVEEGLDLAKTFQHLESCKNDTVGIVDYSVSQATLEQIFIRFAREQEEEPANKQRDDVRGANQQQLDME